MTEENKQLVQIPAEKLIDALLHAKQFEQHYATQESVDNLRIQMDSQFQQVDRRFEQMDKRFDKLETKFDRLQWFIVAAALGLMFKDVIFKLATVTL